MNKIVDFALRVVAIGIAGALAYILCKGMGLLFMWWLI